MKKIAYIFPGQGSQALGMGKSFIESFDQAKDMLSEANEALGYDLGKVLVDNEGDRLGKTAFTQPAILFVSLAAYRLFESEMPIRPVYALGHSLGELTAVSAMGGLSLTDAVKTASERGKAMQAACEGINAGMMVALGLSDEVIEAVCAAARADQKQVWAANFNCDGQVVIAGIKSDLETLVEPIKAAGAKRAMLLDMSVASHCPLLKEAQEPLKNLLKEKLSANLIAPIISNATTAAYTAKSDAIELLGDQLVKPVLYRKSIAQIEAEVDLFIEFGHGGVLKGLNKKITQKETIAIANAEDLMAAIELLENEQ
ncbi:malonyl CoA-acyl carrier protein transacylase [Campylobacterota bacterium]|nr:malonyl CoA-acyl carrier protein transacylase [Campylobacterota bacterium]